MEENLKPKMKVKLLGRAQLPKQGREGDAGYDLFLNNDAIFKPGKVEVIPTGICIELPEGYAANLAMRSSVCKTGLILQTPLIDENYRGQIHIIVYNPTDHIIAYRAGDRICSLYMFPVYQPELEVVEELSESNRGTSWSGSSGK